MLTSDGLTWIQYCFPNITRPRTGPKKQERHVTSRIGSCLATLGSNKIFSKILGKLTDYSDRLYQVLRLLYMQLLSQPRGGVRTIPACNAVRRGFLHIIDFSLCAVIVRSAFAVFTPRGFKSFRKDLSKKIVKWWIFPLCMERKLRFWVDTSFCVFTVCSLCVKTAFNLDSGRITV